MFGRALDGIAAGQEVILLTWLLKGRRDVLQVHPRDDQNNPLTGVFATRAPDRPIPSGCTASACSPCACVSSLWKRSTVRRWSTSSRYCRVRSMLEMNLGRSYPKRGSAAI